MAASSASGVTKEMFDFQGQTRIGEREEELQEYHNKYVAQHPQLQEVLHDYMQALLFHKPEDALGFTAEYFAQHREKQGKYEEK